jgi:peptidoglycan/LPS O-acetylase OafA/YrhL
MVEARAADFAPSKERLAVLDALRFVAAMLVVLFHFAGRPSPAWGVPPAVVFPRLSEIAHYGSLGVYLFFMVSGFVVLMSVFGRSPASFVASRVGRLYPAYWFAVLATGALLLLDRPFNEVTSQVRLPDVILNLTMLQSAWGAPDVDGVYWTLWVELKFYLLLGLLALVGVTRTRILLLCAFWPTVGALAQTTGEHLLVALLEPNFAPFFALGMLVYLVWQEGWTTPSVLLMVLNWAFAMRVAYSYVLPWNIGIGDAVLPYPAVAAVLTLMLIAVIAATLSPLSRVRWRVLTLAGALTYPLYLMHEIWGWWLIRLLYPAVGAYATLAITIVVALVVAWLINRFVERPFGPRLRRALERGLTRGGPPSRIRSAQSRTAID